jgi:hypothetical protein
MKTLTTKQKAAKAKKMREYRAEKKTTAAVDTMLYLASLAEKAGKSQSTNEPKAVAPKAVAPKAVAPKAVAPKAVAPKAVAPKADDRRITLLTKVNPYRQGTTAEATFELLRKSRTVAAFRAGIKVAHAGTVDPSYLTWATKPHGKQPAYIVVK